MKEKRGLLIYLIGAVMLGVSVFLPYFRYKLEMENLIEYKESYNLMHVKEMETQFVGIGTVSLFTRIMIYLVLAAGIFGVCLAFFLLMSGRKQNLGLMKVMTALPPVLALISWCVIKKDRVIQNVHDFIIYAKTDMIEEGFQGSGGYGAGVFLMIAGICICILGVIFYLYDTREL